MSPEEKAVAAELARADLYAFSRLMFLSRRGYLWQCAPHHKTICLALMRVYRGECKRLIINIPPRYSKAIDNDTPMWTQRGWVSAGDVSVGDRLLGSNGRWTNVIGVHPQGVKLAYRVAFSDGASIIACGEHRWAARLRDKVECRDWTAPWHIKTTDEIKADLTEADGRKKWRIPVLVDGNDVDVDLPLDPYLFGCWLGDGHSYYAAITSMDPEIVAAFADFDPKPFTHQNGGKATTYGLRNGFVTRLRALGVLKNKHIPDCYMRASHQQRLALLQGLCDTDGWVAAANGQQGVCFTNRRLSDDVRSLIASLGCVWRGFESKTYNGKTSYKTFLTMPSGMCAFRLQRKIANINPRSARNVPRRFFAAIEPVDPRPMVCFTVDADDHLFCAGRDFIVTHNTELAVVNFMGWALGKNPDAEFIHTSYSGRLAASNAWQTRELVTHEVYREIFPHVELRGDSKARDEWRTSEGGCVYAVGAGGTITGYGAGKMRPAFGGCIIIDDPQKPDEVRSDVIRKGTIEWFQNTLESRKNSPETPIILIMQRLHEEDLAGWLLAGGNGETWDHVCLPAIQEDGSALWPEKHSIDDLKRMQEAAHYTFAGQYQQRPTPLEGGIFKPDSLIPVDSASDAKTWIRAWDLAATQDDGDWTVGTLLGKRGDGSWVIGDSVRLQGRPDEVEAAILSTANRDGVSVRISIPQDPGQAGKSQVAYLSKALSGFRVSASVESGDKVTRAEPFASQVNVGNVSMVRAEWNGPLVSEMRNFPFGKHDDQIDALSRAFNELSAVRGSMTITDSILRRSAQPARR